MENKKEKYLLKKEQKENERLVRVREKKTKKTISLVSLVLLIGGGIFLLLNYLPEADRQNKGKATVFYSPDCICCVKYISYLKRNGFEVIEEKDFSKRIDVLEENQVSSEMAGCHTSIIEDYFVDGLVPIEAIDKLLDEKPKISGITLPGMPQGAPGMPGFKVGKWTIYSLTDGQPSEFMIL